MLLLTPLLTLLLLPLPATAILRLKLQTWFPADAAYWAAAASKCETEITSYLINNRTETCRTPCSCAADCILDNIPGTLEANYASAQVVLGLVPAVLLLIGPSIAEVAAISTRRPLLAVLIALGCPTSYLGRVFRRVDVCEVLDERGRSLIGNTVARYSIDREKSGRSGLHPGNTTRVGADIMVKRRRRFMVRRAIELIMYALALLAVANGVQISVYTDLRTISGWRCGALFMPMVWFLMSVVEHGWGMIAVRVLLWSHGGHVSPDSKKTTANAYLDSTGSYTVVSPSQAGPRPYLRCPTTHPLRCLLNSESYTQLPLAQPTLWSELIFWIAQASALVHMIFGIFELSSLVFISALESVQVFVRFAISVVLCQIVVQIELATMRAELRYQSEQVSAASAGTQVAMGGSSEQIVLASLAGSVGSAGSQDSGRNGGGSIQVVGGGVRTSGITNAD
jgi:hypothetical protein